MANSILDWYYEPPKEGIWTGRESEKDLHLYQKVQFANLKEGMPDIGDDWHFGLIGYACDEGVKRNQGRIGAASGPTAIRQALGRLPNHLPYRQKIFDFGNIHCPDAELEQSQKSLSEAVSRMRQNGFFSIALGGSHDIALGHYLGLETVVGKGESLGIINFDAHFDLRKDVDGSTSGTPFYQIADHCKTEGRDFRYLCLGIREDANDKSLFDTATVKGVNYIEWENFQMHRLTAIKRDLNQFLKNRDAVYVSIDLDGFSSAYAPGVSAASPMGFAPNIVLEALKIILHSGKLIGMDVAELNPEYDRDNQTAKLAASLIHFVIHRLALL